MGNVDSEDCDVGGVGEDDIFGGPCDKDTSSPPCVICVCAGVMGKREYKYSSSMLIWRR